MLRRPPATIAGCIWTCRPEQLDTYADRLESVFDITLPVVETGGLTMRSASDSGLHVIAADGPVEPGLWGFVVDVADAMTASRPSTTAPSDQPARRVHDALETRGLAPAEPFFGRHVYLRAAPRSEATGLRGRSVDRLPYPYLFVWVVPPAELAGYAAALTERFGADFEYAAIPGARVAVAWDSGFELIAPEPREIALVDGHLDETTTDPHYDHIRTHGASPWSIVLRVADIEAFRERAATLGQHPSRELQETDPAVRQSWYRSWTRKLIEQREVRLPPLLGLRLMAGQVSYVHDEDPV
jgi:hypothetical protein